MYFSRASLAKQVNRVYYYLVAEIVATAWHIQRKGGAVFFFKVKSHAGVDGNLAVDSAAAFAAEFGGPAPLDVPGADP